MVNIAKKEKDKKARLVVAWREAYKTESHDTSTKNNKVNGTINKKKSQNPVLVLHESVRNEKGGAKTVRTGAGRRKRGRHHHGGGT